LPGDAVSSLKNASWTVARWLSVGWLAIWLHRKSELRRCGWFRSFRAAASIDRRGDSIPWFTYGAIEFLRRCDLSEVRVFEYGAGASTTWFAKRAKEVISVEHDPRWARLAASVAGTKVVVRPPGSEYIHEIEAHGVFDLVIVDGLDRRECALAAMGCLSRHGAIVWDNSDRIEFLETVNELDAAGFRSLPFSGLAPITFVGSETTFLYRSGANCLGI